MKRRIILELEVLTRAEGDEAMYAVWSVLEDQGHSDDRAGELISRLSIVPPGCKPIPIQQDRWTEEPTP